MRLVMYIYNTRKTNTFRGNDYVYPTRAARFAPHGP